MKKLAVVGCELGKTRIHHQHQYLGEELTGLRVQKYYFFLHTQISGDKVI